MRIPMASIALGALLVAPVSWADDAADICAELAQPPEPALVMTRSSGGREQGLTAKRAGRSPLSAVDSFAAPSAASEGLVRRYGVANTAFGPHLVPENAAWMNDEYHRMQVYSPSFDPHTEWYDKGYEYKDLYAIYDCANDVCGESPEHWALYCAAMEAEADPAQDGWIVRNDLGEPLYIPYGCKDGLCPQLAGDVRNPDFRAFWIAQMTATLEQGDYRGVFVDDVNLDLGRSVADGDGCRLIDGCGWTTDATPDEWADHVALFTEEIRTALPDLEIAHNSVWFHRQPGDPYLERQIEAADFVMVERGINDPGLQAGAGIFGIDSFLDYIDYVHGLGPGVIHLVSPSTPRGQSPDGEGPWIIAPMRSVEAQVEYGLAAMLLTSDGSDMYGATAFTGPDDGWEGFHADLGEALDAYYVDVEGLYVREFEHGLVLLNGPQTWPATVNLPATHYSLAGEAIDDLTLGSRIGRVLLSDPPDEPPAIDSLTWR